MMTCCQPLPRVAAGRRDAATQVLMDYRFNPHMPHPEWYSPVDPEAAAKMWATDKRDRAAQALLEKPW